MLAAVLVLAACGSTGTTPFAEMPPINSIDHRIWFAAADEGNDRLLQALIDDGVDPLVEEDGLTALHVVARNGHVDAARVLIGTGIDVDPGPDARQAELADAIGHGSPGMVDMVAGRKLDPETIAHLSSLKTPLNLAVQNGHVEMVEFLIEAGADVNAGGEWYSPLHSAILYGNIDVVALLIEAGASLNDRVRIQDRSRFSGFRYVNPVELAELIGRADIAELLRSRGARD
jgi:ankyrin repeat protein